MRRSVSAVARELWRTALIAWAVLKRPQWQMIGLALFLGAFAAGSASQAALVLSLIVAMALAALALKILGVQSLTPWAAVRSLLYTPPIWRIAVSGLLVAVIVAFLQLVPLVLRSAAWAADTLNGDADLMVALCVALFMAASAIIIRSVRVVELRLTKREQATDNRVENDQRAVELEQLEQSVRYWDEASKSLMFAVIALIPAALLANWAWNIAASVALPIFVLSVSQARQNAAATPDHQAPEDASGRANRLDDQ